jgi:hypothetical protein
MNRLPVLLPLLFAATALFAADTPALSAAPGTPRMFTEPERKWVDTYLRATHERTATEFGNQMGFGFDRMEPLILFHWFTKRLRSQYDVELLGRLKEPTPVVYTNPLPTANGEKQLWDESFSLRRTKISLPTAEQYKNAPARQLLPIEETALKAIRKGEILYWEQVGDDVRAVGALNAKKDCAECHKSRENELLGAFTYRISTKSLLEQMYPRSTKDEKPPREPGNRQRER